MENFSLYSKEFEFLFEENLRQFSEKIIKTDDPALIRKQYCLFFPSCEANSKKDVEFLIYGQATNGWKPKFTVKLHKKDLVREAIEYSNTTDKGEYCPLDWVNKRWNEQSIHASFFWNVIYKLINQYYKYPDDSHDWCKHMIWSNLMKISPAKGGNPYGILWEFQFDGAKKLFLQELNEIHPKFVVILTNLDWAMDFLDDKSIFTMDSKGQGKFIQAKGYYKNYSKVIVTKRPFMGNSNQCVEEILNLIK